MRYETKFYNWDLFCVIGGKIFKFYIVIFTDGKILNSTLLYSQMKNIKFYIVIFTDEKYLDSTLLYSLVENI